ncbi:unnamed protein product [Musa textilis]
MFSTLMYFEVKRLKLGKGTFKYAMYLSDFKDDEELHLFPYYNHIFHLDYIDTWLASHITCPVCHANLIKQIDNDNLDLLSIFALAINMVGLQLETIAPS